MESPRATSRVQRVGVRGRFLIGASVVALVSCVLVSASGAALLKASKKPHTFTKTELAAALDYIYPSLTAKQGPANPKLSPVSIGWVSDQTAVTGVGHEGNNDGAQTAAVLLNDNLGGIQGHPVKLVTCFIKTSEADGATCAQQMLNNPAVHIVVTGELLTGEASFVNTMNGQKPVIGVFTNGPGLTAKNTYYLSPGIRGQIAAVPFIANQLHAKKVAILGPNIPAAATALGQFTKLFAAMGVSSTISLFDPSATDLTGPIAASGVQSADAAFFVGQTTSACIAMAKAFTQLAVKTPVVTLPFCLGPEVKAALGDFPNWYYDFTTVNPLAVHKAASPTTTFAAAMQAYSSPKYMTSGFAPLTFGAVLTVAKWINAVGLKNYNESSMITAITGFTGPMFMGDPNISFGNPPFPNVGATRASFYHYDGNGKFTTSALWLCAPIPGCQQH